MTLPPRQHDILELARERGYVSIDELAQAFAVTPQTIRRDINQLAELGLLYTAPNTTSRLVYDLPQTSASGGGRSGPNCFILTASAMGRLGLS